MGSAPPTPAILHVDMDCFYVSVERLHNRALEGKPVAVGGSAQGRGVVASASYEARAFGVRSAMPMAKALRLCPHLIVVSGGYGRYGQYSRRIEEIMLEFTPLVQMASQDEAYLDLTGTERLHGPPLRAAQQLRERIHKETQLPCSLGLGTNKLIAKVASSICKPKALLHVPAGSEALFIGRLPVKEIPGVGNKGAEKLKELGLVYARDVAALAPEHLERHFGSWGRELSERCRGIHNGAVHLDNLPKSVGAEETLDADTVDAEELDSLLSFLAEKVAWRMRRKGLKGSTVTLKYRYSDFETHTAALTLSSPTDDELTICSSARELLARKWNRAHRIRLLGVSVGSLTFGEEQMDLLDTGMKEQQHKVHQAVDKLREKYGRDVIRRASSGRRE